MKLFSGRLGRGLQLLTVFLLLFLGQTVFGLGDFEFAVAEELDQAHS
jgi:hypothetical protein